MTTARSLTEADLDAIEERFARLLGKRVPRPDVPKPTITPEKRAAAQEKARRALRRNGVGWPR